MRLIKRILYFLYYLVATDIKQLSDFLNYSSEKYGKQRILIFFDMVYSVFKYNVSFKDFFCFGFLDLCPTERRKWAGTGFMYEFQLEMNPKRARIILIDKIRFLEHFREFVSRKHYNIKTLRKHKSIVHELLINDTGKLVLKRSRGQVGAEVEVIKCKNFNASSLMSYMKKKKYDLIEEFVIQHPDLMELSPSGLNTIRVITQMTGKEVVIIGARLRISVNSSVDNMAAGNLASSIDVETGIVIGPGVYSDIRKSKQDIHPITGKSIVGFKIPFWAEVIDLARSAALRTPENRSIGWDIAVTSKGPELIEGNHNWCKLLWQLPVQKGLKEEVAKFLF